MKKMYGLLAGLIIAVLFPTVVSAEASFDLVCDPLEVARNGETNCTVKIASTDGQPIGSVSTIVTIENEPQMSYAGVVSVNNGWTDVSNGQNLKFNYSGTAAISSASDIATFRVKVAADATECGNVCITSLTYDGTVGIATPLCQTIRLQNSGTTIIPDTPIIDNPIIDNSTTEDNPQTGSFVPYVVISGAALLAIGAIVVASKKSKFYNI